MRGDRAGIGRCFRAVDIRSGHRLAQGKAAVMPGGGALADLGAQRQPQIPRGCGAGGTYSSFSPLQPAQHTADRAPHRQHAPRVEQPERGEVEQEPDPEARHHPEQRGHGEQHPRHPVLREAEREENHPDEHRRHQPASFPASGAR